MAAILKITKIFMGTPSKTILNQLRYIHAKFGAFVQRVTIFSLSHLTIYSSNKLFMKLLSGEPGQILYTFSRLCMVGLVLTLLWRRYHGHFLSYNSWFDNPETLQSGVKLSETNSVRLKRFDCTIKPLYADTLLARHPSNKDSWFCHKSHYFSYNEPL